MKRLSLLALLSTILLAACETDFQLEGEWKDIPVIYGFLSVQDDTHYVRVERAFLEPGGDATEIARIADSIFYAPEAAEVRLEVDGESYLMERFDGADVGFEREEGDFVNTPNILYRLPANTANIRPEDVFTIVVDRGGEKVAAQASSVMLGEVEIPTPLPTNYNFGDYNGNTRVSFRTDDENIQVFDVRLRLHYQESLDGDPANFVDKTADWILDRSYLRESGTSRFDIRQRNEQFYAFVADALDPIPNGRRRFSYMTIEINGAGQEIRDFLRVADANIGITSSQAIPIYSNVTDGLGIVSSRYSVSSPPINITTQSLDSLYEGSYTRNLGFRP